MEPLRRAVAPVADVVHAARRPATYAGHGRELVSAALTVGMWPLGLRDGGPPIPDDRRSSVVEAPVLLVHGFGANKSNWLLVRRRLEQAGFGNVNALNYNPLTADIPELARRCAERADDLRERFGAQRVHMIGHSLGGIIARYAVQVLQPEGVSSCITVASPHGGVRLARYGTPLARISPLATGMQLRPDSPVMKLLRSSAHATATRFVAYYSNLDMVVPARRAMIQEPELDATNILVKDHGHLSIMLSRRLATSVVDQLAAIEGLPGYGTPVRSLPPASDSATGPEVATASA